MNKNNVSLQRSDNQEEIASLSLAMTHYLNCHRERNEMKRGDLWTA
jgi:hypothetical protein